jgi:hypothetical protein
MNNLISSIYAFLFGLTLPHWAVAYNKKISSSDLSIQLFALRTGQTYLEDTYPRITF